jgi:hypothetical protein
MTTYLVDTHYDLRVRPHSQKVELLAKVTADTLTLLTVYDLSC